MKRLTVPGINNHVDNFVWVYGEDGLPGQLITDDFDEYKYIKKLQEYEDLEEQGKLLKLPCTVGDAVYEVNDGKIYERKIMGIENKVLAIDENGSIIGEFEGDCFIAQSAAEIEEIRKEGQR